MTTIKHYKEGMELEGYILDMPNETYHAAEGISKSGLDVISRDPYHYFNRKPMEQTRFMQVGSAIHAAMLEPKVFANEFVLLPDVKNRQQKEYKEQVKIHGEGKVFTGVDVENILNMQKAVHANEEAHRLLTAKGYSELSGIVRDPETGVQCRHRFDRLNTEDDWAVDLKKTQSCGYEEFSKSIQNYRYHVQAAFYLDQYFWITGKRLKGMKFIAVEEKYPHKVAIYYLDDSSVAIGRELYREDLNKYAYYDKTGIRPTNNEKATMISLPNWVLRQYENELEDGGIIA